MSLALDLETVEAFVRIAELESFTRAANELGISQAAVSLRLRRLEDRVGRRLIERTSRYVQLSVHGIAFLEHARKLLLAHEQAVGAISRGRERLRIGLSDLVAGPDLPRLVASFGAVVPTVLVEIRIGSSSDLLQSYDRRELDVVISRLDFERSDGIRIAEERLRWFASSSWAGFDDEFLPLVTLSQSCGVRALTEKLLDDAGISWFEAFVGGGAAAVAAAVDAGLGVAALAPRMVQAGTIEIGDRLALPAIPSLPIVMHSRCTSRDGLEVLELLASFLRDATQATPDLIA